MTGLEQLIQYGAYIPVMTKDEQRRLAMGELRPTAYQICGWCRALMMRQDEMEKRLSEAMQKAQKPPKNRK